ncbi:MAG: class I SAM-dependent methyltransferase [Bacteroidales bacterium]|nr:class I SAM-dependent methyltransferase [Bacteroidales bacterium]
MIKTSFHRTLSCKICDQEANYVFNSTILKKYEISYFQCTNCKYLFTEKPFWLEEAYKEPINISDTGLVERNIYLSKITSRVLFYLFDHEGTYLDYGGGYGLYVRLMRDIGFNFLWDDIFTTNLLSKGFEFSNESIELLTCFETFEHLENPIIEIEKMLKISSNILFTTELYPEPMPSPENWWYYALDHGQHISFYNLRTLNFIADKFDLNIYSNGTNLHLFTSKKLNKYIWQMLISKRFLFILDKLMKRKLISKTWTDHIKAKSV